MGGDLWFTINAHSVVHCRRAVVLTADTLNWGQECAQQGTRADGRLVATREVAVLQTG